MNCSSEYQNKLIQADEAVKIVKSGDLVHYGEFMMISADLDAALAKRVDAINNVTIQASNCQFEPEVVRADPERLHFIYVDMHMSAAGRKLHDKNLCNYMPLTYHEGGSFYERGYVKPDVAMIKVAPMDRHGFFNLGTTCSLTPQICDAARTVIVEVNKSVPICLGGSRDSIHISEIDYIVEGENQPMPQLPEMSISDTDRKIASIVLGEIKDGACLQLGIGAMPNAVGAMIAQSDLKDLGVHTEMLVDSFVDMYEAGRITGRYKQLDKYKMVYTFAMGTNKLYDFLDRNPGCAIYPGEYTNDPAVICQNNNVVGINNAMQVDLFGQVASESSGIRHVSGSGGQLDFIFGAYNSRGGKGLICLTSTFKDKNGHLSSRICPTLSPGTIVTVPRSITHYVVTEYGIAMLKGKSTWQRAEALINVAHPAQRDELIREADKMHIWIRSNKIA
jgi:Acetyl-CoA hydrolase